MAQKEIKDWNTETVAEDDWLIKQSTAGVTGKAAVLSLRTPVLVYAGEYLSTYTYAQNQIVNSGGVLYKSLQNSNVGHTPASSPTWWGTVVPSPVLHDATVSGSAVQNYDISSLSTLACQLHVMGKNGDAVNGAATSIYINGDYTAANYHRNGMNSTNGAAPTGFEAANPSTFTIGALDGYYFIFDIVCGPVVAFMSGVLHYRDASDNIATRFQTIVYNGTNPSSITSIRIGTDRASGIAVGSRFLLRSLEL